MLYDRFDDMRSKNSGGGSSGEYDFNLSRIGTPVSCIAQSNIAKGNKIVGIKNENYSPELLNESLAQNIKENQKVSEDLSVIIEKTSSSLITIFIKNSSSSYTSILYNLPNDFTAFGDAVVNENGTLCAVGLTQSSNIPAIVMIEIDKENQTANYYYFNDFSTYFSNMNYFTIRKNVLCSYTQNSGTIAKNIPVYNTETHTFSTFTITDTVTNGNLMYNGTSGQTDYAGASYFTWYNDNTLLVCTARTGGQSASIYKFVFSWTNNTIVGSSDQIKSSGYYQINIFNKGSIVAIGNWNSNNTRFDSIEIYSFNPDTLTYNLEYTYSSYSQGFLIVENKLIITDNSNYNYLFDITNLSNPQQLYYLQEVLRFNRYFFTRRLNGLPKNNNIIATTSSSGSSANCQKRLIIFDSGVAEYIINSTNSNNIDSNKIYGIASKSLSTGEIGNEQLLWSTIT